MVDIARVQVPLVGTGVVGTSVLTMYTRGLGGALASGIGAWLDAWKVNLPTDVSYLIPAGGDMIDDATGDIVGTWTGAASTTVTGTGGGVYALGVGVSVRWNTSGIVASHHVRGRTYIVPIIGTSFTSDGTLAPTIGAALQSGAATLISATSNNMCIWSRPTATRAGSSHLVTSGTVGYLPSWLKTRKT